MARDKSPGLKILWLWTLGTAAILVTNAVRTRLRDMEQLMNNGEQIQQQQQQQQQIGFADSIIMDTTPESDNGMFKQVK